MKTEAMGEGRNIFGPNAQQVAHGGAIDAVRARYQNVNDTWIDLSTGISPFAYPIPEIETQAWARLPLYEDERSLLGAAKKRYRVPAWAAVVAAPGTQAIIQVLPRIFERGRVAIVGPTYAEHFICWRRAGFDVCEAQSLIELLAHKPDVLVVVNPNNPTGRICDRAQLIAAADELASTGGTLVVDEAFVDLCDDGVSLIPSLPDNAIVLRSFGKTYGLAGVRLGFAVLSQDSAARLRGDLGPWSVSGPALEIGRRALSDDSWLSSHRERMVRASRRLETLLHQSGFEIVGTNPLFVFAQADDAVVTLDALARAGIHVRHFPEHLGWLRFGIPGDEPAWDRLAVALKSFSRAA